MTERIPGEMPFTVSIFEVLEENEAELERGIWFSLDDGEDNIPCFGPYNNEAEMKHAMVAILTELFGDTFQVEGVVVEDARSGDN